MKARSSDNLSSTASAPALVRNAAPTRVARRNDKNGEKGQGLAEYIIIVILVAIIVLVAVRLFGKSVFNQFSNATKQVDDLESSPPKN